MTEDSTEIEVIPHQYAIVLVFGDTVSLSEIGAPEGTQTISIAGKANVERLIAALNRVKEGLS